MTTTLECRTLNLSIECPPAKVYAFAAEPKNMAKWAAGIGKLKRADEGWITETPQGTLRVHFTEANDFGILDHWVVPDDGEAVYIPLRIIANGGGSEILFTLFRQPGMTQEVFEADAVAVWRDLETLKRLLEE